MREVGRVRQMVYWMHNNTMIRGVLVFFFKARYKVTLRRAANNTPAGSGVV